MQKHGLDDLSDLEVVPTYGHTQEISQKGPKKIIQDPNGLGVWLGWNHLKLNLNSVG